MIREATFDDIPQLIKIGEEFHQYQNDGTEYDKVAVFNKCSEMIKDPNSVIFVSEGGMIGGSVVPIWYSNQTQAAEFAWCGSGGGISLLRQFETWAKEKGATRVVMAHLLVEGAERVEAIYDKLGYKKAEVAYYKELI